MEDNPCKKATCEQLCLLAPHKSSPVGFTCKCKPGYRLGDDGTCIQKDEPFLMVIKENQVSGAWNGHLFMPSHVLFWKVFVQIWNNLSPNSSLKYQSQCFKDMFINQGVFHTKKESAMRILKLIQHKNTSPVRWRCIFSRSLVNLFFFHEKLRVLPKFWLKHMYVLQEKIEVSDQKI